MPWHHPSGGRCTPCQPKTTEHARGRHPLLRALRQHNPSPGRIDGQNQLIEKISTPKNEWGAWGIQKHTPHGEGPSPDAEGQRPHTRPHTPLCNAHHLCLRERRPD
jgi:hypothetical protein